MIPHNVVEFGTQLRQWQPAIANHLWQSTVFAAAAWLLTLALKKNQARARHWIWMAASLKFVIPFALLVALGGHFARPRTVAPPSTLLAYSVEDMSAPFVTPVRTATTVAAPREKSGAAEVLPLAVAAVWMTGFLAVLVRWGVRWRRVAKSMRSAAWEVDGREVEALRRIERAVGLSAPIELRTLNEAMEPGVFGVLRPVLLWPSRISERLDDAQLDAVMAHEVCHVRRRDNLTAALHMLVEAAFWFHPLVWWLGARLVEERERACDEAVLLLCDRPAVYAQSILKVCEFCVESPLVCMSGVTGADLKQRVFQIMTKRVGPKLSWAKKSLLAAMAVGVTAAPVFFGGMRLIPVYGQMLHASGPLPSYEVAVFKPSQEPAQGQTVDGEQVHLVTTAKLMIQLAYNVPMANDSQVTGGPDWIDTNVYDVLAKTDAATYTAMRPMNRIQRRERVQLLNQSLLAERMKLKVHFETRDIPVLGLVVAKGGPKLQPAKDTTPQSATIMPDGGDPDRAASLRRGVVVSRKGTNFELTAKGVTLADLAKVLIPRPEMDGRMVVDLTGIAGQYDFTLRWGPDHPGPPADGEAVVAEEPPLLSAIQQQLGLKLIPTKGPAEVIVIDHIEKPSLDGMGAAKGTLGR